MIVDDHPVVRDGLSTLISRQPDLSVCGEAAACGEAIALLETARPDLVIVDISLADGNGIELIKRIKARGDSARVLVSSMHDEGLYAERALRAGAMGYISKQEATHKIITAIHKVLEGKVYLSEGMADRFFRRVARGSVDRSPIESLADRELQVFELIG
jgi:DNA-binding NarL/FixJ family response regulator